MKKESMKSEGIVNKESILSFIIGTAIGVGVGALVAASRSGVTRKSNSPVKDFSNIEKSTRNLKSKLKKSFEELENQFHEFKEYVTDKES